jgi:choice-of-anchor C domain-containing protein
MKAKISHLMCSTCLTVMLFGSLSTSIGQVVVNGSFELGMNPGDSLYVPAPDSTTITGWSVTSGSVDYIGTHWAAADGNRSIDLSGHSAGTLAQQSIAGFTVGMSYRLSFDMAANTESGPTIKSLTASIGSTSQVFSFDGTSHSSASMGWSLRTLDFVANSPTMTLSFSSLDDGLAGPALDAVSLAPIPEPGTLALGALAVCGTVLAWRRQRA